MGRWCEEDDGIRCSVSAWQAGVVSNVPSAHSRVPIWMKVRGAPSEVRFDKAHPVLRSCGQFNSSTLV
jgi:hypothetical protein